jgi:hypothetical protein
LGKAHDEEREDVGENDRKSGCAIERVSGRKARRIRVGSVATKTATAADQAADANEREVTPQKLASKLAAFKVACAARWTLSVLEFADPDDPNEPMELPRLRHYRVGETWVACERRPPGAAKRSRAVLHARIAEGHVETAAGDFVKIRRVGRATILVAQGLAFLANHDGEAFHPRLPSELASRVSYSKKTVDRELKVLERFFPCRRLPPGSRFPKRKQYNDHGYETTTYRAACPYGGVVFDLRSMFGDGPEDERYPLRGLGSSRIEAFRDDHALTPCARAIRSEANSRRYKDSGGVEAWAGRAKFARQTRWSRRMISEAMREQMADHVNKSVFPSSTYVSVRNGETHYSRRRAYAACAPERIMASTYLKPGDTLPNGETVRVGAVIRRMILKPEPELPDAKRAEAPAPAPTHIESYAVQQIVAYFTAHFESDGDEKQWAKHARRILATKKPNGRLVSLREVLSAIETAAAKDWFRDARFRHRQTLKFLIGSYKALRACGGTLFDEPSLEEARQLAREDARERAEAEARKANVQLELAAQAERMRQGTAPKLIEKPPPKSWKGAS